MMNAEGILIVPEQNCKWLLCVKECIIRYDEERFFLL